MPNFIDDLETVFGKFSDVIPTKLIDDVFIMSSKNIPRAKEYMSTDKIIIEKGFHDYLDYYRADMITIHSSKRTFRQIASLMLSVIFHDDISEINLNLINPISDIKMLTISYDHVDIDQALGYVTRPFALGYEPKETPRFPVGLTGDPYDLPCFFLSGSAEQLLQTSEDWNRRNILRGFGRDRGFILFAQLLLDISRPDAIITEYKLEGPAGIGGVGPMSAEVRILLPGHPYWNTAL